MTDTILRAHTEAFERTISGFLAKRAGYFNEASTLSWVSGLPVLAVIRF